jgi:hypothetical protein
MQIRDPKPKEPTWMAERTLAVEGHGLFSSPRYSVGHSVDREFDVAIEPSLFENYATTSSGYRISGPAPQRMALSHDYDNRIAKLEAHVVELRRSVASLSESNASLSKSNAVLVELAFGALVDEWKRETEHLSSITDKITHRTYKRIVELGTDVLPHIFREMERRPGHWHSALARIVGSVPATVAAARSVSEGCTAWIAWAREQGYKW